MSCSVGEPCIRKHDFYAQIANPIIRYLLILYFSRSRDIYVREKNISTQDLEGIRDNQWKIRKSDDYNVLLESR